MTCGYAPNRSTSPHRTRPTSQQFLRSPKLTASRLALRRPRRINKPSAARANYPVRLPRASSIRKRPPAARITPLTPQPPRPAPASYPKTTPRPRPAARITPLTPKPTRAPKPAAAPTPATPLRARAVPPLPSPHPLRGASLGQSTGTPRQLILNKPPQRSTCG
ncbi:hypothetical protein Aglo01_59120 [Actinokineospora globicatena]|nr:hypothetical protein Aglo01_59120 [Actinokineospora globicatena]GLW87871.1 hypothetical protein Aglo02_55100 [Actinokineospora globicatena]